MEISCSSQKRSFLTFLFLLNVLIYWEGYLKVSGCFDSERKALTTFRKALNDPSNIRLSSWDDETSASDCCKWRGITCHNITGYVLQLDLHTAENIRYIDSYGIDPASGLSGRIDPALVELKHLQFLDLSYNAFHGSPIPDFLGSMKELRHLNLSSAGFSGRIPHQLGNLSKLISFQLSSSSLSAKNLWWLTRLPSLKYLDMSGVNLSMASHDWVHVMNKCPSLIELDLSFCGLSYISPTLASVNFTSLRVLYLFGNEFNSRSIPNWIANISSLVSLSLSVNKFQGQILYQFSQLPNLEELWLESTDDHNNWSEILEGSWSKLKLLQLSFNQQLQGGIPVSIGNITSLVDLYLSFSGENITGGGIPRAITKLINLERLYLYGYHMHAAIPDWLGELKNLKYLILYDCMLTGQIPAALGGLSSLETLDLSRNELNGTIPATFGQLSNLSRLHLAINSLTGNVSESLFENLKKLNVLFLSSNSLVFDPHSDWAPPFQLSLIGLGSCHLGPRFPPWLRTQKYIEYLNLSNTTISDIMPTWFWDLTPQLDRLKLSNNQISGQLPNPLKMQPQAYCIDLSSNNFSGPIPCILNGAIVLDLSNNQFSGPIPPNFTSTMHKLEFFSAKGNQISGMIIPSFIEGMKSLTALDLSRNNISGIIPLSLGNCVALEALDLSKNRLSGGIPRSFGLLRQLQTIHLSNNSLSGKILSLKKCASLETLDLGDNDFSGQIPPWISKSFPGLRILRLRSNMFTGNIPPLLLNLTSLQILDVAQNCLSGSIPQSLENLTAMKEQKTNLSLFYGGAGSSYYKENLFVSVKGQMLEYTRTVSLVICMDFSRNNLSGEIPEGLTSLLGLRALNLSGNHLIEKIPNKIGELALLESLDFSKNQLSGTIPHSMSSLTFLSYLNLSSNNLSGKIPVGNQLQTLQDPSIYMGNNGLCGPPLTDKCDSDETSQGPTPVGGDVKDGGNEMFWFYSAMGPGFAVGFWAFCGVLMLKKSWRIAYYRFFDAIGVRLFCNCCFTR